MNANLDYDNKIITYAGDLIWSDRPWSDQYFWGGLGNFKLWSLGSDGIVPIDSAHFDGHAVKTRSLPNYDHSQVASGNCDANNSSCVNGIDAFLFGKIGQDLIIPDTTTPNSNLVPQQVTLSSKTLSSGQSFTASWILANTGAVKANANSTTVC